jgi:hypothetical protein
VAHLHKSDFRAVPISANGAELLKLILNSLAWTVVVFAALAWIGGR